MSGSSTSLIVPKRVVENCRKTPERLAWLAGLPGAVHEVAQRWSLTLGRPFDGPEVSAAWVAPARRADGTAAVLKLGMPHPEAEHEIDGLRFWDGRPTVRLLAADDVFGAMLLERCQPGTPLRSLPEVEQDVIVARLLRRLWRVPEQPHPFRALPEMIDLWTRETRADEARWTEPGLVREGLAVFEELIRDSDSFDPALLATDLHAGNILRAEREPWLVIDPKPFVGDRTYDATQHLLNCEARLRDAPHETIARFADLLEVDGERVRLWTFARAAAESRDEWDDSWVQIARALAR